MQTQFIAPSKIRNAAVQLRPALEIDHGPVSPGIDIPARLAQIDHAKLDHWRLDRLRKQLAKGDFAGALLCDPMNIRYATGTHDMSVWTMHAPGRYAFVPRAVPSPTHLRSDTTGRRLLSGRANLKD